MRTFNRDAFKQMVYIKKTRGNRVFQFTPTLRDSVNKKFPQLTISYQRLLPIHSLEDLDDATIDIMVSLIRNSFINLKPVDLHTIDIIDTYCQDPEFTTIYLYDKHENYLGKIVTCAPNNMIYQVINSRCKKAEYWATSGGPEFGKTYQPKTTSIC